MGKIAATTTTIHCGNTVATTPLGHHLVQQFFVMQYILLILFKAMVSKYCNDVALSTINTFCSNTKHNLFKNNVCDKTQRICMCCPRNPKAKRI